MGKMLMIELEQCSLVQKENKQFFLHCEKMERRSLKENFVFFVFGKFLGKDPEMGGGVDRGLYERRDFIVNGSKAAREKAKLEIWFLLNSRVFIKNG